MPPVVMPPPVMHQHVTHRHVTLPRAMHRHVTHRRVTHPHVTHRHRWRKKSFNSSGGISRDLPVYSTCGALDGALTPEPAAPGGRPPLMGKSFLHLASNEDSTH
jgi:hypothetical protein